MKVDFYIAGVQKSGTTNLAYLLSNCANVITHPQMECTFFYNEEEYKRGLDFLRNSYFFNANGQVDGKAYKLMKHSNSFTSVETLDRVIRHFPDVKILLVFRNPVQRFVSSYLMEQTRSLYSYDLRVAVDRALKHKDGFEYQVFYLFGEYDRWLSRILQKVSEKQIHYFLFEELFEDTEHHLEQFGKQYGLNINTAVIKQLPVQNVHKEYKHYYYQKLIVHLRHSRIKETVKKFIPVRHWVKWTKKLEHINLVEPQEKYVIDREIEEVLMERYYSSIKNFETITGLKTNWLNEK